MTMMMAMPDDRQREHRTTGKTIALTTLQQQCQARVCQLEGVASVVSDDVSTMTRTHLWVSVLLAAV